MVIYDAEIKKGIVRRGEEKLPGIEYCDGWRDYKNMGVSVVCAYSYDDDRYRIFCADNFDEMVELFASADIIAGFNNEAFDDELLKVAVLGFDDIVTRRYDLLREIWRAAGLKDTWGSPSTHGGFGLAAMCEANYGYTKSGHGADAPVDWQRGKIGSVIDYCMWDIGLTKKLMDAALASESIINPKGGTLLLRNPVSHYEFLEDEQAFADVEAGRDPGYRDGRMHETNVSSTNQSGGVTDGEVNLNELQHEQASKTLPETPDPDPHHWDNLVIEIEQLQSEDKYMVAVHNADGLVIKRKLMLHEWSHEDLNNALLRKDGPAIVRYLQEHEKLYKNIGDESGEA
jgi:hypothetical protein